MFLKKGLSLIEMLIYVAILTAIFVFVVNSILITIKSFNGYRVTRYIAASAEAAMERMTREIRLANDINEASVFDGHPGHLILNSIEFFASSTQLMVKETSQNAEALTPAGVELINLVFREVATSTNSTSKTIKVEMELKAGKGNYQKTAKFYNTVVLRGSY